MWILHSLRPGTLLPRARTCHATSPGAVPARCLSNTGLCAENELRTRPRYSNRRWVGKPRRSSSRSLDVPARLGLDRAGLMTACAVTVCLEPLPVPDIALEELPRSGPAAARDAATGLPAGAAPTSAPSSAGQLRARARRHRSQPRAASPRAPAPSTPGRRLTARGASRGSSPDGCPTAPFPLPVLP